MVNAIKSIEMICCKVLEKEIRHLATQALGVLIFKKQPHGKFRGCKGFLQFLQGVLADILPDKFIYVVRSGLPDTICLIGIKTLTDDCF